MLGTIQYHNRMSVELGVLVNLTFLEFRILKDASTNYLNL
uniref:Uncharacterized protein n=1 Tax=Rhizophora mucronata TaxID=61149 RepID=A0A2P2MD44_RHIMU